MNVKIAFEFIYCVILIYILLEYKKGIYGTGDNVTIFAQLPHTHLAGLCFQLFIYLYVNCFCLFNLFLFLKDDKCFLK